VIRLRNASVTDNSLRCLSMAHMWRFRSAEGWRASSLDGILSSFGPASVYRAATTDAWVLLVAPGAAVSVNGRQVLAGVAVIRHMDEIQLAECSPMYFVSESPTRVEAFEGRGALPCARCQQPIESGQLSAKCPRCGLFHHQSEALPCWTYAERCSGCDHSTALDGALAWTPESL